MASTHEDHADHRHASGHSEHPLSDRAGGGDHAGHAHGLGHAHGPTSGRAFAVSVGMNGIFVVIEVAAGLFSHSMALVADAAHNFGDVLGLLMAWGAAHLATRKPSARRTYGFRRSTILASVANAVILLVSVGAVSWEAIGRLRAGGQDIQGTVVIVVAAVGVVINLASALPFLKGRKGDVNVRGAFTHLIADAAVSVGVVVAGALMIITHWMWLDAVVSLAVSIVILGSTWSLLRDSLNLALDAVPEGIDPEEVRKFLCGLDGVTEVHDLHIWGMSTTENALTAHLIARANVCPPGFLRDASDALRKRFGVHHATLQLEPPDETHECAHAPEDVV
jgi:cobalt-zinc-cadmium efflux system protein